MTQRMYLVLSLLIVAGGLIFGRNNPELVIFLAATLALMCVGFIADKRENAKHEPEDLPRA